LPCPASGHAHRPLVSCQRTGSTPTFCSGSTFTLRSLAALFIPFRRERKARLIFLSPSAAFPPFFFCLPPPSASNPRKLYKKCRNPQLPPTHNFLKTKLAGEVKGSGERFRGLVILHPQRLHFALFAFGACDFVGLPFVFIPSVF